ncbi:hypothetical protein PHSY_002028 [Pseudozyma hubeiensis SY62]|uniref:Uncharacterized protein n=1 Tax=Pseudozyma hubeiensis (strain SY62) TaxID=1305764 RepID=R9P0B6_PSEHS|nr:hypothetical protein PHSY_002028 [Pseudozyma hubeiensis SY62]GAC94457.1 hypothetical protein PHSY_002028 [Pseudozyma hubeiensis SY62]
MRVDPKFGSGTIVADNLTADDFLAMVEDGNAHFGGGGCMMLCATQPFPSSSTLVSLFDVSARSDLLTPAMDRIAPPESQWHGISVNDT